MRTISLATMISAFALICVPSLAENPDCETFEATQPNAMVNDVKITYTWDPECGEDPALGPLSRDDEEISVEWSHDLDSEPHEHTAADTDLSPGVYEYTLLVTPPGEDGYLLEDSAMVSGTEPIGDDDDDDDDDEEEPEEDTDVERMGSSDSGGCSIAMPTNNFSFVSLLLSVLL